MDVVTSVQQDDLVRSNWFVDGHEFEVWVEASSLATEESLELHRDVAEGACWLSFGCLSFEKLGNKYNLSVRITFVKSN